MGIIHRGIPQEKVLDRFGDSYDVLVESGTHVAKSAIWASDWFNQVYTIESELVYHRKSMINVARLGKDNIQLYYGRSVDVLPSIINILEHNRTPAIFWLDAHWSRDLEGDKPDVVCPVLQEITLINKSFLNHVILVDDARLFGREPGWPELDEVMFYLGRNAYVEDDVIWRR